MQINAISLGRKQLFGHEISNSTEPATYDSTKQI